MLRFSIEPKRLPNDVREPEQLLFSQTSEASSFVIQRLMMAKQVKGVDDSFQRIIDFVGNDSGDSPHSSQPLGFAQSFFGLQSQSYVAVNFENCAWLTATVGFYRLPACDNNLPAIASGVNQVPFPFSVCQQHTLPAPISVSRLSAQEIPNALAMHFLATPAVQLLGSRTPELDQAVHVPD